MEQHAGFKALSYYLPRLRFRVALYWTCDYWQATLWFRRKMWRTTRRRRCPSAPSPRTATDQEGT